MAALNSLSPRARKILEELRAGLEKLYGHQLERLIVYGSYARGEERPLDSDLDVVAIITDMQDRWEEVKRTSHLIADLSLEYGVTVSLLLVRRDDWDRGEELLYSNVREEGIAA